MSVLLRRATGAIGRPSVWLVLVLLLDAAIAITGIFLAHGSGLLGLLAAGPLLACARCGARATAFAAAYAIALCAIAAATAGVEDSTLASYRFIMVIVAGVVAVFVSVIRGHREVALIRINDCGHHPPAKVSGRSAGWQLIAPEPPVPPLGLHPCPARRLGRGARRARSGGRCRPGGRPAPRARWRAARRRRAADLERARAVAHQAPGNASQQLISTSRVR